jgi:hypothetical protein
VPELPLPDERPTTVGGVLVPLGVRVVVVLVVVVVVPPRPPHHHQPEPVEP